jgi:hypothetical protein
MDFAVPASMFVTVVQASRRTLLDEFPLAVNLSISALILYWATYVMARRAFGTDPGEVSLQALTPSLADADREHRSERRDTRSLNLFHIRHGAAVMSTVTPPDGAMEWKT